jgi:hypothetical protein
VNLNDPVATALFAAEALERAGCRYALMGGLLMAAYGEPRETRDSDFAVVDLSVARAHEVLSAAGLHCLVATRDPGATAGGLSIGRLTLLGGDEHLGLNVLDIVRTRSARYGDAAMSRSIRVPLRDRAIQALSPEDFVIFKALSTRDRDVEDAESVVRRSAELLDVPLIEREVAMLSVEVPDWDVRGRWTAIRARGAATS